MRQHLGWNPQEVTTSRPPGTAPEIHQHQSQAISLGSRGSPSPFLSFLPPFSSFLLLFPPLLSSFLLVEVGRESLTIVDYRCRIARDPVGLLRSPKRSHRQEGTPEKNPRESR